MGCNPKFRFGMVADVQYADIPDRGNRNYRNTINVLKQAVNFWGSCPKLDFVVHAGDLLDYANTKIGRGTSETMRSLELVMKTLHPGIGCSTIS